MFDLFFLFTEAKPIMYYSNREGITYHNDKSGKVTPIIPKINGENLVSHSGTIINLKSIRYIEIELGK